MNTVKSLFPRSAFVGFDHLLNELDHVARHANDKFPPHNIVRRAEGQYRIELAVAGFYEDEIEVTVEDRTLIVTGNHEVKGRDYVYQGISTKNFKRTFRLSEYVEVSGANLQNGLLVIDLKVVLPEEKLPRKIPINGAFEEKKDAEKNSKSYFGRAPSKG